MPKFLDHDGTAFFWDRVKQIRENTFTYYSHTTAEWNSDVTLVSQKDILYIYTDHRVIEKDGKEIILPGFKLGDGKSYLIDLPFLNNDTDIDPSFIDHINNTIVHITNEERNFWNNKLNCSLRNEILIFNRQ